VNTNIQYRDTIFTM